MTLTILDEEYKLRKDFVLWRQTVGPSVSQSVTDVSHAIEVESLGL